MNINLNNRDMINLIKAILAIVTGIYLKFHQQEAENYLINALLG